MCFSVLNMKSFRALDIYAKFKKSHNIVFDFKDTIVLPYDKTPPDGWRLMRRAEVTSELSYILKVVTYLMFNIGNNRRCILAQKMAIYH